MEIQIPQNLKEFYPDQILQKYADSLTRQTKGDLSGQVNNVIINDGMGLPHIVYALLVYLAKIKQSYRLFEIEQIKETVYPVNLKVFFYTGMQEFNNLPTPKELEDCLDNLVSSPGVSMLITHFLKLSDLKD